jgi:hypothetical protein
MADHTEPELQLAADSLKVPSSPDTQALRNLENSAPMLDVHAPHESIHTWKSFFIHIATIVVGLFIAVGLEQTVEFFRHRHQHEVLEEQMNAVLQSNRSIDAEGIANLNAGRMYFVQLRAAIDARLHGRYGVPMPSVNDPRMAARLTLPSLAPYEAARQNGMIALLPIERIRIYNRIAVQQDLLIATMRDWLAGLAVLGAFHERFGDSTGNLEFGQVSLAPELNDLTPGQLDEYLTIVSTLIKRTDVLVQRYRAFDIECSAILKGVGSEEELLKEAIASLSSGGDLPPTAPAK